MSPYKRLLVLKGEWRNTCGLEIQSKQNLSKKFLNGICIQEIKATDRFYEWELYRLPSLTIFPSLTSLIKIRSAAGYKAKLMLTTKAISSQNSIAYIRLLRKQFAPRVHMMKLATSNTHVPESSDSAFSGHSPRNTTGQGKAFRGSLCTCGPHPPSAVLSPCGLLCRNANGDVLPSGTFLLFLPSSIHQ